MCCWYLYVCGFYAHYVFKCLFSRGCGSNGHNTQSGVPFGQLSCPLIFSGTCLIYKVLKEELVKNCELTPIASLIDMKSKGKSWDERFNYAVTWFFAPAAAAVLWALPITLSPSLSALEVALLLSRLHSYFLPGLFLPRSPSIVSAHPQSASLFVYILLGRVEFCCPYIICYVYEVCFRIPIDGKTCKTCCVILGLPV